MKSKQYIPVKPYPLTGEVKKPEKKGLTQHDKIARLYALAKKLNVKIGG